MTNATPTRLHAALSKHYGAVDPPPTRDAFELVLYEQVAYLATDAKRRSAFDALRTRVGLTARAIEAAKESELTAVCRLGGAIAFAERAQRLRASASLLLAQFGGQSEGLVARPEAEARRALQQFAMIGEPGADRILAIVGVGSRVPADSNALRVLERLTLAAPSSNYATQYHAAQQSLRETPASIRVELGRLLSTHGKELCKRTAPRCGGCPLREMCPSRDAV